MNPGDLRRFHDDSFIVGGPDGHLNSAVFLIMTVHSGSPDVAWVDILVHGGISEGWSSGGITDLSEPIND